MNAPSNVPHPRLNIRTLIILNAALLAALAFITFAGAPAGAQVRGRGEYTMVAGRAAGSDAAIIYVADVANQELIALTYNHHTKQLDGLDYRNLAADAATVLRRARPGN